MKLLTGLCLMLFCLTGQAQQSVFSLCSLATTTGVKTAVQLSPGAKTFQASMTVSSGSGTGAVTVEGSNDNTWFDSIGTLSVTQAASDSITPYAPAYLWYRCNVTGETGTGAKVSVNVRQGDNP
jgi:hypothetical protein